MVTHTSWNHNVVRQERFISYSHKICCSSDQLLKYGDLGLHILPFLWFHRLNIWNTEGEDER